MIRLANLLQAPTVSIYQLVKTKTFALHLFDMVLLQIIIFMACSWSKFEETENNFDEGENDEVGYY